MRKRLQLAFMLTATTAIATSFSLFCATPPVWAAEGDGTPQVITTSEEHGRRVYVNEPAPAQKHAHPGRRARPFLVVVWGNKKNAREAVPCGDRASQFFFFLPKYTSDERL